MEVMDDEPLIHNYEDFIDLNCGLYIARIPCVSSPSFMARRADHVIRMELYGLDEKVRRHFNKVWK